MSKTCFTCHGPDAAANDSGFQIDSFASATANLPSDDALVGIKPGDPQASEVYLRITGESDGEVMPPTDFRHRLSEYDKSLFRRWIEQGAEYEQHWSYARLDKPEIPSVEKYADEIINPVDAFILARLVREGIEPSGLADRKTLLRRLSLDLTGLPPTPEQIAAFEQDVAPGAYERQVDNLLKSPHFGERMAIDWLDLVRFADTVGFHGDQNQRIFPYRDYVIRSFNENKPFDQFTREQIAGDLLNRPTADELTATGLLRLNMVTREGGAQPKEYLAKYKADRVRMIGTAWLGSTLACCECHNHKYDPFTIKDFYSLGAYFDDLQQWGVYADYGYTKNPELQGFNNDYPFPPELRVESESLRSEIAGLQADRDRRLGEALVVDDTDRWLPNDKDMDKWLKSARGILAGTSDGWLPPTVEAVETSDGVQGQILDDQSVRITGEVKQDDSFRLQTSVSETVWVNAIRVEVLPDSAHAGRVGRGTDGKFELSLEALVRPFKPGSAPEIEIRPRYIRIELPGNDKILSLAEVEVFGRDEGGEPDNVARRGTASQSSLHPNGEAEKAIDGNTEGDWHTAYSVTHTESSTDPWWEVDLGEAQQVERVVVWNRTDNNYADRLKGLKIIALDDARRELFSYSPELPSPSVAIDIPATTLLKEGKPLEFAFIQTDRQAPRGYRGGHFPVSTAMPWRSGPAVHQLPSDETRLPHTGVFHLKNPLELSSDENLELKIESADVGRVRISLTSFPDPLPGWPAAEEGLLNALDTTPDERTPTQTQQLLSAAHRSVRPESERHELANYYRQEIAKARSGLAMTMIAQSVPATQRTGLVSRVLPRGNWQDESGELAPPQTPHFLPLPTDASRETASAEIEASRLELADWLVSDENPLVARHFANRTWKQFFGTGLSSKLDDLGSQGEWPSHPQLLDWLAAEFRDNGWNVKELVRTLVTSRTYRQTAATRRDLMEIDPYNRLLAQQSPRRLEAEFIRDNALAISGLLQTNYVGGPSVFPYQPDGHYGNLQFPDRNYMASGDYRQYRRGVYMHWQRTFLHPMLVNFDAPSRDECTADRSLSNSPQQALTLLNDPSFVEAAAAFAARLVDEAPQADFTTRLDRAFRLALARPATDAERNSLQALYARQLDHYRDSPDDATNLLSSNSFNSTFQSTNQAELAAWTQVCRVLLNLQETITRY